MSEQGRSPLTTCHIFSPNAAISAWTHSHQGADFLRTPGAIYMCCTAMSISILSFGFSSGTAEVCNCRFATGKGLV